MWSCDVCKTNINDVSRSASLPWQFKMLPQNFHTQLQLMITVSSTVIVILPHLWNIQYQLWKLYCTASYSNLASFAEFCRVRVVAFPYAYLKAPHFYIYKYGVELRIKLNSKPFIQLPSDPFLPSSHSSLRRAAASLSVSSKSLIHSCISLWNSDKTHMWAWEMNRWMK